MISRRLPEPMGELTTLTTPLTTEIPSVVRCIHLISFQFTTLTTDPEPSLKTPKCLYTRRRQTTGPTIDGKVLELNPESSRFHVFSYRSPWGDLQ